MSGPTPVPELLRQVRQARDWARLTEAIPYARFLGLHLEEVAGEVLCRLAYAPELIGNRFIPALHGGTLSALLESAAIFELLLRPDTEHVPKVISLTVDYLRSGRPRDTWARAHVARLGRRVANVRVEAWQEERARPIASANVLFLLAR